MAVSAHVSANLETVHRAHAFRLTRARARKARAQIPHLAKMKIVENVDLSTKGRIVLMLEILISQIVKDIQCITVPLIKTQIALKKRVSDLLLVECLAQGCIFPEISQKQNLMVRLFSNA